LGNPPIADTAVRHDNTRADAGDRPGDANSDLILIMGASAIADRHDVIPAAMEASAAGSRASALPVDPVTWLVLGTGRQDDDRPPGCARSPKINGFDWVLQRILADIPVGNDDIAAMASAACSARSRPRSRATGNRRATLAGRRWCALVLAAGRSSRMGRNKLCSISTASRSSATRSIRHWVPA